MSEKWAEGQHILIKNAVETLAPAGGLFIQNGGAPGLGGNGYMFESFNAHNDTITTLLRLGRQGIAVQAHTDFYSGTANPSMFDSLAAFLIGVSPGMYWAGPFGWEVFLDEDIAQRWLPEFEKPLGKPSNDAVYGNGVWRRSFEHGVRVLLAIEPVCQGSIHWGDGTVSVGSGGC